MQGKGAVAAGSPLHRGPLSSPGLGFSLETLPFPPDYSVSIASAPSLSTAGPTGRRTVSRCLDI